MNKHLKKFHNMHAGKRCFLVGSAPTILNYDLSLLENDFLIGTNQIYKFYKNGLPAIDYYFAGDFLLLSKRGRDKFDGYNVDNVGRKFYRKGKYEIHIDSMDNAIPYWIEPSDMIEYGFNIDITKGLYHGYTIAHGALAFAVYFGFNPVYIIGVDLEYKNKDDLHFNSDKAIRCFQEIKKTCDENNIKIYNASEYGILDVFPRVKYRGLF